MVVPSEKATRYDRQLRLWGDHGQKALESAHICLINASGTGTEILKNLVLPGIGAFTIIDKKRVTQADLGNNFFVTADSIAKPRGKVTLEFLQELNNEVKGDYIDDEFETLLSTNVDFFSTFTIVIATELPEERLLMLAQSCWKSSIPLLVVRAYGLIGYLRIALSHHEIIESHPDSFHEDVRLDFPFPHLLSHMNSIKLEEMDNKQHGDVPYLVVLYKYLEIWKQRHDDEIPKNYREKKQFKEMISSGIRKNEDGVPLDEENFEEAIRNVNSMILPTVIPATVREILDDPACTCITPESSNFWLLARAVREFVQSEGKGRLPLRGSIPDMTSSSSMYIKLQRVYQAQAREDVEAVANHLTRLLTSIGRSPTSISEEDTKQFCRNSTFLRVLRYRSLEEEYQTSPNQELLRRQLEDPNSNLLYYVLLRAAQQFHLRHKFYPGEEKGAFELNIVEMKQIVANLLQQMGVVSSGAINDDHITEFCRYGGCEIHSVAAFLGGVAAQEVIKLITHQFVPFNNTFIYNAASSTTLTEML